MKMHRFFVLLAVVFLVFMSFMPVSEAATAEDGEVLRLVNEVRQQKGLAPLVMDSVINKAAAIRAAEMERLFAHDRPDGSDCLTVFREVGMTYRTAGENLVSGMDLTPERAVDDWVDSPAHLDNILYAPFTHTGIAHFTLSNGKVYWVQLFAAPTSGRGEEVQPEDLTGENSAASNSQDGTAVPAEGNGSEAAAFPCGLAELAGEPNLLSLDAASCDELVYDRLYHMFQRFTVRDRAVLQAVAEALKNVRVEGYANRGEVDGYSETFRFHMQDGTWIVLTFNAHNFFTDIEELRRGKSYRLSGDERLWQLTQYIAAQPAFRVY